MGRRLTWELFTGEILPGVLSEWGLTNAQEVGRGIAERATSYAQSGRSSRLAIRAPFIEEVAGYEPSGATPGLLATVCVIVRCSALEDAHADGLVGDGGIKSITEMAAGPLSQWLAEQGEATGGLAGVFEGLDDRWPRAWAALDALARAERGGRAAFRMPDASTPDLPSEEEMLPARTTPGGHSILSGIDPRFDEFAVSLLNTAGPDMVSFVSSLSRLSRNLDKALRMIEIVLSRGGTLLTANHMIRPAEVFTRKGALVRPNSLQPLSALEDLTGLSGVHRKMVLIARASLAA